jgi:hypothetical protein
LVDTCHFLFSGWQQQRVANALAIQNIYQSDVVFNGRPLPKYYHTSDKKHVKALLTDMTIKFAQSAYPGAWVATGYLILTIIIYLTIVLRKIIITITHRLTEIIIALFSLGFYKWYVNYYNPVYSFSSVLELPVSDVSNKSHNMQLAQNNNFFGLGRLHDSTF